MALVLRDRVRETSTTSGTGTFTLAGAVSGFQSFSVIGNGNTTFYCIVDSTSATWEVGIGTYTASGTTLSRDSVLESSNSNTLVSFAVGTTKDVFCTYPADRAVVQVTPVTKTGDFTLAEGESWVINNKSGSTCTVTLPAASTFPGRAVTFQNYQNQTLVSASANVTPRGGGTAATAILDNVAGNWATLVSDGTTWVIMQAATFNNLLLE
jgi:hypothetical protein